MADYIATHPYTLRLCHLLVICWRRRRCSLCCTVYYTCCTVYYTCRTVYYMAAAGGLTPRQVATNTQAKALLEKTRTSYNASQRFNATEVRARNKYVGKYQSCMVEGAHGGRVQFIRH